MRRSSSQQVHRPLSASSRCPWETRAAVMGAGRWTCGPSPDCSLVLLDREVRVHKVFNGYLRITNENFVDAYENSNSTEFMNLASKVKEAVSATHHVCSDTPHPASQRGGLPTAVWAAASLVPPILS